MRPSYAFAPNATLYGRIAFQDADSRGIDTEFPAPSSREREVLGMVGRGLSNKQIAYELGIAEKTVQMHRALLLDRIGATTTADAIRIAVEAGL